MKIHIVIEIQYFPMGLVKNKSALVQLMACHQRRVRPISWNNLNAQRSEILPTAPWLPILAIHIRSHVTKRKSKLQIKKNCQKFKFCNNPYTWHSFWSCLIRCANMKWSWLVLWKIQSGHGYVHRRTDGRTDMKPVYPPFNFVEVGAIMMAKFIIECLIWHQASVS